MYNSIVTRETLQCRQISASGRVPSLRQSDPVDFVGVLFILFIVFNRANVHLAHLVSQEYRHPTLDEYLSIRELHFLQHRHPVSMLIIRTTTIGWDEETIRSNAIYSAGSIRICSEIRIDVEDDG